MGAGGRRSPSRREMRSYSAYGSGPRSAPWVHSTRRHSRIDRASSRGSTVAASTQQEVLTEIRRIAASELELERAVEPSDELIRDLQLDSLGLTILAVGLEDRFRIRLTEEDSARVSTVADLASLVASRASGAQP